MDNIELRHAGRTVVESVRNAVKMGGKGVILTARSAGTWDNSLLLWHGEGSPPSLNAHLAAAGSH